MARPLNKLTDAAVKKKPVGRYSDGGGLYLYVSSDLNRSWVFRWTQDGKRREMGLGAYPLVALVDARTRAYDARKTVEQNGDPIAEKKKEAEPSFSDCVDKFLASMETQWRNEKHRDQWRMTLTVYCKALKDRKVSTIGTEDVLKALKPIWGTKAETASRLRGRIERVLDFAKAKGWRSGENPALWRGHLKNILPARQKLARGHHAAMPYPDVPALIGRLRKSEGLSARMLEFLILTASRTSEVTQADWKEIDWKAQVWTIPPSRMKAGREHRVPLTGAALAVLKPLHELRKEGFIFPGTKPSKPLSNLAMTMLLRRLKVDFTVHGFRSSFRDWAGDATSFPRELAEAALAHVVGDETERAYRRSDAIAKRRKLMEAWALYLAQATVNVIKLKA